MKKNIVRALFTALVLSIASITNAAQPKQAPITVTSAEPSFATNTIAISGTNFSTTATFAGTVTLFIPGQDAVALPVNSFINGEIVAGFPPALATMPGTYQLTVSNGGSSGTLDVAFVMAGPAGPAGPEGLVGPQGPPGSEGLVGPQGPAGPVGLVGPQGPAGPEGLVGPQGPAGPQGLVGPQGPPGSDGLVGPQGPAGPVGLVGPQGPAGPPGTGSSRITFRSAASSVTVAPEVDIPSRVVGFNKLTGTSSLLITYSDTAGTHAQLGADFADIVVRWTVYLDGVPTGIVRQLTRIQYTPETGQPYTKDAATIVGRLVGIAPGVHNITVRASFAPEQVDVQMGSLNWPFLMEVQEVEGAISY